MWWANENRNLNRSEWGKCELWNRKGETGLQRHIQAVEKFTISRGAKKCAVAEMEAVNYMRVKSVHADVEVYFSCKQNPAKTLKGA